MTENELKIGPSEVDDVLAYMAEETDAPLHTWGYLGRDRRRYLLARAVQRLGLQGHEAGFDLELAAAQLKNERKGVSRWFAIWNAADKAYLDLLEPNAWLAFYEGHNAIKVEIPDLKYSGHVKWPEVARHIESNPEEWRDAAIRTIPEGTRHQELAALQPTFGGGYHDGIFVDAIVQAIGAQGLFRGPCITCGRELWAVPWRQPEKAGRRPLSDTLCPACEVQHKRKVKALDQQALRRRRSSGRSPGRPRKNP